jgi:dipeptidyl aminopeptidase/acylaminoacyl peptidase
MSKKMFLTGLGVISALLFLRAQQAAPKILAQGDVAGWKRIENTTLSANGRWVAYSLTPNEGDASLHLYDGQSQKTLDFPRGERAAFSADEQFFVFAIKPGREELAAKRRLKVKKEDLPGDTLAILDLNTLQIRKVAQLKSFQLPSRWTDWLAYHLEPEKTTQRDTTGKDKKKENADNGSRLVLLNLKSQAETIAPFVKSFALAEEAPFALFHTTGNDAGLTSGIYLFDPSSTSGFKPILRAKGQFKNLKMDRKGTQAAFIADLDSTKAQIRPWALYHWKGGSDTAKLAVGKGHPLLKEQLIISEHANLSFSKDGSKLFFGTARPPVLQDTTLLEEEIVQVEVWNYRDERIYPQQKVQLNADQRKSFSAVWHTANGKAVALGTPEHPEVITGKEGDALFALAYTTAPYQASSTWEGGTARDVFLIDLQTGKSQLLEKGLRGSPSFSPEAKYVFWYSEPDTAWYTYNILNKTKVKAAGNHVGRFYDELNDVPDYPSSYGLAGWTTQDDYLMLYDRYDLWLIDPSGRQKPVNLTNGRESKVRMRYIRTNPEERAIEEVKPLLLHFRDEKTREEGYLWYDIHAGSKRIVQQGPYSYRPQVLKARNAVRYLFSRESYQEFPDLLYSSNLSDFVKISQANPQQKDFGWGSISLYEWTSLDGQKLQGLLVKPAGFDPSRKYPMIVNFYERSSDGLHLHRMPDWHRSQINYTYYASRGYLVFNPDIPYREGYPGESAYNAVVSGTTSLIDQGFVDKERIGIQGHSWGGYQIAYLLTKTDLFKCAESGAPVVNMISAYGGIRWESGVSRMFQYEKQQSRIGASLWDKPLRYLENSPIFFADKINTPVLIMHNDADGAVPWYQGIEFYMAMRRLNKPSWMLNYNGEPHWPVKLQNRKDFQLRMEQFFDHYLQEKPMPKWMRDGVPAIEKGIRQGYELTDGQ